MVNKFNDDVIWGSLLGLRAYDIWQDGGMLTMARQNFDLVWARAWDTNLGGGLWWKTDKQSKNTCVNAPAIICALKLYKATGDASYRDKAKLLLHGKCLANGRPVRQATRKYMAVREKG
jgi:predicted alpha-1,6-mannanase (GH76 family)